MSVFGLQLANLRRRRLLLLIFVHGKVGISVCIASMQTGSQTHILVWFLSYYEVDYLCAHLFFKGTAKWGDIRKTCVWPTNVFYGKLLQSQTNHHYPSLPLFFYVFLFPSRVSIHSVMSVLEMFVALNLLYQENNHEDEKLCVQFQPQDNQPRIPVSTGCAMSLSRLCSTLTNSSKLRFPSRFASNKWKTISTTVSERDMPHTWNYYNQTK